MILRQRRRLAAAGLIATAALGWGLGQQPGAQAGGKLDPYAPLEWQLPNEKWMVPFKDEKPISFVTRSSNLDDWTKLTKFWTPTTEEAVDPRTGEKVTRQAVKIKVPLGLNSPPPVPIETPMTVRRWALGRDLYFDPVLSSDNSVSCSSCHSPKLGWTDQSAVSIGIGGQKGGVSSPTVLNTGYNFRQFWDGRAGSLEEQAQGPVGNALEMFGEKEHAWPKAIQRVRKKGNYVARFKEAFGVEPTRDAAARAIAQFERTVLSGNSIADRAELAMRIRVADEGGTQPKFSPKDYEGVLKEAFANKDADALKALGLSDAAKIPEVAQMVHAGRELFFNKARCSLCHVGDNFTDNLFHNLGVGVKDGKIPEGGEGRFGALPTGAKDASQMGAFKTPTLRGLVGTGPYMHDGSEKTLEQVIDFYDKGGNANRYLDLKMRDVEAEKAYLLAKKNGGDGPKVHVFAPDDYPIAPFQLKLTKEEKAALVAYLRTLEGDPADPIVADPTTPIPALPPTKKE